MCMYVCVCVWGGGVSKLRASIKKYKNKHFHMYYPQFISDKFYKKRSSFNFLTLFLNIKNDYHHIFFLLKYENFHIIY